MREGETPNLEITDSNPTAKLLLIRGLFLLIFFQFIELLSSFSR